MGSLATAGCPRVGSFGKHPASAGHLRGRLLSMGKGTAVGVDAAAAPPTPVGR